MPFQFNRLGKYGVAPRKGAAAWSNIAGVQPPGRDHDAHRVGVRFHPGKPQPDLCSIAS